MSNDWSDPERAERELRRREASNADPEGNTPQLRELLLDILEEQKRLRTETASHTDDIAGVRDQAARIERALSDLSRRLPEDGIGKQLAQTEGRIVAHVDRLEEGVRPVGEALPNILEMARTAAATPEELRKLGATVERQGEAVRGQTFAANSQSTYLEHLGVELKDMVQETELRLEARFIAEAKSVREVHQETTALVLKRRRRSRRFWLILMGAIAIGMLACVAGGVWLQWEHTLVSPRDPTLG